MPPTSPDPEPMDDDALRDALRRLAAHLDAPLGDDAAAAPARLVVFAQLTARWNAKLNLVGSAEVEPLVEVLFADALILAELLPDGVGFVDVGAGGGAPSIPLLLLRGDTRATLVEPRRKRVAFLRSALGELDLVERGAVLERRLEDGALPGAPFDLALSRATFPPAEWLARAEGLAAYTVVLGVDALPDAPEGTRLERSRHYRLPFADRPRVAGLYVVQEAPG